jgi:hypothetical protein
VVLVRNTAHCTEGMRGGWGNEHAKKRLVG